MPALPRIILEQQADGTIVMETYLDGARSRFPLAKGLEIIEIREELRQQASRIASAAERKALREAELEAAKHRRVWTNVAYGEYGGSRGHGAEFANRTVGKINLNPVSNPTVTKEPTAPKGDFVAATDLL
jgi:hypothetical protein